MSDREIDCFDSCRDPRCDREHPRGVASMDDLLKKYGTKTIGLVVARLIERAPSFPGDGELAHGLGVMMADLETALSDYYNRYMRPAPRICQVCNKVINGHPVCRCLP